MAGRGWFPVPNRVLIEACRRPVAASVYMALASTDHVWTARDGLEPYQVRVSRAKLVSTTGATPDRIRTALSWLVRRGFLERRDTSRTATAIYRIVPWRELLTPKRSRGASDQPPKGYDTAKTTESPRTPENPQANPQAKPQAENGSNSRNKNDLQSDPTRRIPKQGAKQKAKVLEDQQRSPSKAPVVGNDPGPRACDPEPGGAPVARASELPDVPRDAGPMALPLALGIRPPGALGMQPDGVVLEHAKRKREKWRAEIKARAQRNGDAGTFDATETPTEE